MSPALLKPAEAAALLGISTAQLARLTDDGLVPFIDIGRGPKRPARRYEPADIEAFKATRRKVECRSTGAKGQRPTATTSGLGVVDFQATLEKLRSEKRAASKNPRA